MGRTVIVDDFYADLMDGLNEDERAKYAIFLANWERTRYKNGPTLDGDGDPVDVYDFAIEGAQILLDARMSGE